jgi:diaphanous 1
MRLAKHLISLRVHLSTVKLAWIECFVGEQSGMDALGTLLIGLVGKGDTRKLTDTEETVLLEVVRCQRVLLNTEVSNSSLMRRCGFE